MHSTLRSRFVASRVNDGLTRVELARYIRNRRMATREAVAGFNIGPPFNAAEVRGRAGYALLRTEFYRKIIVSNRPRE